MNTKQKASAQVDMRGFQYALKPFVQQQEWFMESLQRELSKAQFALVQAQDELKAMQTKLEMQSAQIQQALGRRFDPLAHRRGLEFLVKLTHRIQKQHRSLEKLRTEKTRIQAECLTQQRKLDGLAEHRTQAQDDFAIEKVRLAAAEADRDWISRIRHNPGINGRGRDGL